VADWVTISSLATAGGTLALAGATYGSVRSANRSARVAERALEERRRPVLVHGDLDGTATTVNFADGHHTTLAAGAASVEADEAGVYLAASLRNVGVGIAVLQGWQAFVLLAAASPDDDEEWRDEWRRTLLRRAPTEIEQFRSLARDSYIASGENGFWQGAVRDRTDPLFSQGRAAVSEERPVAVDLLYTDQVGGQRTISRFALMTVEGERRTIVTRHWYLDAPAPR
jgi:hypothetical protein